MAAAAPNEEFGSSRNATATRQPPPESFSEFHLLVEGRRVRMPRRMSQAAAFLVSHPDQAAFESVAKIAKSADVPPPTLVRFAQSIGFDGFSQLRILFQRRLLLNDSVPEVRSQTSGDLMHQFSQAAARSIRSLDAATSRSMIERAVKILTPAHTIFLVGWGRSAVASFFLSHTLNVFGLRNILVGANLGMATETIDFAGTRDAALITNLAPSDTNVAAQAARLRERGVPVVLITDTLSSSLVRDAAAWFEVTEGAVSGFQTLAGLMCLALTLATAVRDRRQTEVSLQAKS